jgi:hypothetical protein
MWGEGCNEQHDSEPFICFVIRSVFKFGIALREELSLVA